LLLPQEAKALAEVLNDLRQHVVSGCDILRLAVDGEPSVVVIKRLLPLGVFYFCAAHGLNGGNARALPKVLKSQRPSTSAI
jgi:hypothetical protein